MQNVAMTNEKDRIVIAWWMEISIEGPRKKKKDTIFQSDTYSDVKF